MVLTRATLKQRRSQLSSNTTHKQEQNEHSSKVQDQVECTPTVNKDTVQSNTAQDELDELTDKVFERLKKTIEQQGPSDTLELPSSIDHSYELASSLQPDIGETSYFPSKGDGSSVNLCAAEVDKVLKKSVITADFETKDGVPSLTGPSKIARAKANKAARLYSAGSSWFDMPAPDLTPELKTDLQLLRMRNALDPSHHYKANDSKKLPRYFQVGRVISAPGEFYSSRIPRKQRKRTLVEELLADEEARSYHKKKYHELQLKSSSGTKRYRNIKHKKYKK